MADGQPLDDHVGVALRRAYQHAVANLTARIARFDLSPLEFSVLVRLHDVGSWTQNSLGRSIFMEPANIGALVQRLAERGLVTREPDPDDRRAIRVSITPGGRRAAGSGAHRRPTRRTRTRCRSWSPPSAPSSWRCCGG